MKDFSQKYLDKQQLFLHNDPYLYTTPEVREELLQMQGMSTSLINLGQMASVILTAPLTVITASLQLSVKPHKQIFQDPISESKSLAKINTALTIQEKRRMELMLRSGGERRPYTAPVYEGYRGVLRGLSKQGWQAFFKGFFFRMIHQMGHFYAFYQIGLIGSNSTGSAESLYMSWQLLKMWGLMSICDCSLNVFHLAQNRYILQNNIKEFRVFRNASKAIRKMFSRKEIYTAVSYHFLNSFIQVFARFPLYLSFATAISHITLGGLYIAQLLAYPLNTAFRRLACQHTDIPGMIPLRYSGIWHALRLIAQEEGIIGLYRGFGLHHLSMGIKIGCIGMAAPLLLGKNNQE